ncbi:MAG: prepilin peptidase-dependent protein [Pantoea sp.]|uniref:prepilin peptidase-dependent protein n=1 Tax=Pantoea piersonii TaxID=2364647 RepID=UPI0022F14C5A|nr:prepilin peptidase-dependent protein [Pantoea piersonii]MDU6434292.1 prepilin peptidase-dependent protein [Pantoea sp.]WBV20887.1 prepilin peptidase-dependent protein [Pantoea piersonii]
MRLKMAGFSLLEMLVAMAISAVLMLSAGRFLPLLMGENLRLQQRVQLREDLQQVMQTLEKAVRRAGYCNGDCGAAGFSASGDCLLLRWDDNSNGKWEGVAHGESDYYGFRLRQKQLETRRGADGCGGTGWERLTDPAFLAVEQFSVEQAGALIKLRLTGRAGSEQETLESWVEGENL